MKAKCLRLEYQAGDYHSTPSYSNKAPGYLPGLARDGFIVEDHGNGHASVIRPSKLILTIEVEGQTHEVWVDRFFKKVVGRLTAKRRDAISAAMPAEIEVEEKVGRKGTKYFTVPDAELEAWLSRVAL